MSQASPWPAWIIWESGLPHPDRVLHAQKVLSTYTRIDLRPTGAICSGGERIGFMKGVESNRKTVLNGIGVTLPASAQRTWRPISALRYEAARILSTSPLFARALAKWSRPCINAGANAGCLVTVGC